MDGQENHCPPEQVTPLLDLTLIRERLAPKPKCNTTLYAMECHRLIERYERVNRCLLNIAGWLIGTAIVLLCYCWGAQ